MNPSEIYPFPKYKSHLLTLISCLARSRNELPRHPSGEFNRNKKTAELVLQWSIYLSYLRFYLGEEVIQKVNYWSYFTSFLFGAALGLLTRLDLNGISLFLLIFTMILSFSGTFLLYRYQVRRAGFFVQMNQVEKDIAHLGYCLHPDIHSIEDFESQAYKLLINSNPDHAITRSLEYAGIIQSYGWNSIHKVSILKSVVRKYS